MSAIHGDSMSEDESDQASRAAANEDTDASQIAIDFYGLKAKIPAPSLAEPSPIVLEEPPTPKSWKLVWNECHAHLQNCVISLAEVLASIPRSTTRIVKGIGSVIDSASELANRIARGRNMVDSREDQRIAHAENELAHRTEGELESESLVAIQRLEEWKNKQEARGVTPVLTETPEGYIIVIVAPPGMESKLAEEAYNKLLRYRAKCLLSTRDSTPIEELGLSKRILSALKQVNIITVADVRRLDADGLENIPGIGPKSLSQLKAAIRIRGL